MAVHKKYSIILMDDSGLAHRFRMQTRLFVFCLVLMFGVLPVCAAVGGWISYIKWREVERLKADNTELEQKYVKANAKAERLGNLEALLHKLSPSDAEQIVRNLASVKALKADPGGAASEPEDAARAESPAAGAAPAVPSTSVASSSEPPTGSASAAPEAASSVNAKEFAPVDLGRINIEKAYARPATNHRLRITFDLQNQEPKKPVNGRINCILLTAGGQAFPLSATQDMLEFRITRVKPVLIVSPVPENAVLAGGSVVVEVISGENKVIYRDTIPVAQ